MNQVQPHPAATLYKAAKLREGQIVSLNVEAFSTMYHDMLTTWLEENPTARFASIVGPAVGSLHPDGKRWLRWAYNDQLYTATQLLAVINKLATNPEGYGGHAKIDTYAWNYWFMPGAPSGLTQQTVRDAANELR